MSLKHTSKILPDEIYNEDFFNTIENSLKIGSWELNIKSNSLHWSAVTKKIHEVDSDYIPNVNTGINFYKEGHNRNKITTLFNAALNNGEHFDDKFIIITAKGNERWVRSIGRPVYDKGECISIKGVFQDITKQTLNLQKSIIEEEQFRSFFNTSQTGIAILSLNGNWLRVNSSLIKMLGYTEKELLKLTFKDLTYPDDRSKGLEATKLMLDGRLDNFQTEKRYVHKDGSIVYCMLSSSIVRDNNNNPMHFTANIIDITKIKQAKDEINDLLQISSKQNERLLNFAHIVSHNLRSHGGNLEMLLEITKEEHPEATNNECFTHTEQAVKNLNETILNLNEVSIHNTLEEKDLEPLNLLSYVKNSLDNLKAICTINNAKIKVFIDKDLKVMALPAYLDSILINLITNAIKYKKTDTNPEIILEAEKDKNNNVILYVKDNGLGIDLKKHKDKIFGMYNVFHEHKEARGLGLFISKNQIEAIGGKIEVKSSLGIGTEFKIYLKHE